MHKVTTRILSFLALALAVGLSLLSGCSSGDGGTAAPEGPAGLSVVVGAKPRGVAVDSSRGRLVTANEGDGTASIIDLKSLKLISTLKSGTASSAVAVNESTGRAYVANTSS